MRGEQLTTRRIGNGLINLAALLCLTAASAMAQAPVITSVQSSIVNGSPTNTLGITSGSVLPGQGFVIYLNGSFNVALLSAVTWTNAVTLATASLQVINASPAQLQVFVPQARYIPPV